MRNLSTLDSLINQDLKILMLPPRSEDWTQHAITVSKLFPNGSVFYGARGQLDKRSTLESVYRFLSSNKIERREKYLPNTLSYHKDLEITEPNTSKGRLSLAMKSDAKERIFPFFFEGNYSLPLPFENNFFDLAITQTPEGTDVMLYLAYSFPFKPETLSKVLKPHSYWIHMTSSLGLEKESYPYFEMCNEISTNFDNPILSNIFGKDGWRLSPSDKKRINSNPIFGEIVSGESSWILYQRLQKNRDSLKELSE
ncbi:MAG: hypothetical protein VX028_01040 [Nanoarchaeota archaeon]|nr:hypothetical protein [Nanoarchaeota archaeon]